MYAAELDGKPLTFQVFGVWRKNMVMRDLQTGSIWQQATGEAIDGPYQGRRLEVLPGWETTWGALRSANPQAGFAAAPKIFTGLVPKPILKRMLGITLWANLSGLSASDPRLVPHEVVIGLVTNGSARAYPLAELRRCGVIIDQAGGEIIRLEYDRSADRVRVFDGDGSPLHYERLWWSGWSEFHPRSHVFGADPQ